VISSLQENSHIFNRFFNSFDGLQFYTDGAFTDDNWASLHLSSFFSSQTVCYQLIRRSQLLDGAHQTDGSISKNQAWSIWVKDVASVKKINRIM